MTRDPDFAVPETQADATVALSDKTILVISMTGFVVLATTVYLFLIRPSKSAEELADERDGINYDDELDHADVRTLNRAQRRARARNRMKKNRRVVPRPPGHQHQQGEGGEGVEGDAVDADQHQHQQLLLNADVAEGNEEIDQQQHLSRKERAKIAKAAEKEERRLYEKERQEARKQADAAAAAERQEREKDREAAALEEKRRRVIEAEELERAQHEEWKIMFVESRNSSTIKDFIERVGQRKIWPIDDLATEYGVTCTEVERRLGQLMSEDRLFGIVSNGTFIFIEQEEMQAIADFVKQNGATSLSELSNKICRIVT